MYLIKEDAHTWFKNSILKSAFFVSFILIISFISFIFVFEL
jgi:predicted Co/Zn/Cd cation transporter (cation efflux family)